MATSYKGKIDSGRIVTDGLVLYLDAANKESYAGSGTTWTDLSKSGNNATLAGGVTFTSNKKGGLTFNGTTGVGTVPDAGTRITNYNFTLEAVFNFNGNNYTNAPIVNKRNAAAPYNQYAILINNGDPYAGGTGKVLTSMIRDDSSGGANGNPNDRVLTYTLTNAGTYHCVITNSSGQAQMWVNGVLVSTSTASLLSGNFNMTGNNFKIANNNSSGYLGETIYLVRMYNRTLSSSEVLQNFSALRGRFGV